MQLLEIIPLIQNCLLENRSFVAFRLPGEESITVLHSVTAQPIKDYSEHTFDGKGFLFAPFNRDVRAFLLNADRSESIAYEPSELQQLINGIQQSSKLPFTDQLHAEGLSADKTVITQSDFTQKADYINRIQTVIEKIQSGFCEKAVISRKIKIDFDNNKETVLLFLQLAASFPKAFVYLTQIEGIGCWMGASPELLLSAGSANTDELLIHTMALAGTRKSSSKDHPWGDKEIMEHEWVKKYILEKLALINATNVHDGNTHTVKAGPVEHLRTDINAGIKSSQFGELLKILHPTPAVCGWPLHKALELIQYTEDYDRAYYTGYLGPATSLFVNLRCMEIFDNYAYIYVGGGITKDSIPEAEYEETVMKSRTLLNALEKVRY